MCRFAHLACFPHAGAWERLRPPPATSFSLWHHHPPTCIPNCSTCLSCCCNNVLQRFLGPTVILPRVSAFVSCFLRPSVISIVVLWIVGPSSIQVHYFSWKGGPFPCKIHFFWYFSDFQRPVLVRTASMTNKKPSGGVVCYYCHNLSHVRRKCRRLQCKN